MMRHCIAYGRVNSSDELGCAVLHWHSLPMKNKTLLRTWLIEIKRENTPVTKHSYLCSANFSTECFRKSIGGYRAYLKPGSIPTIFSFNQEKPSRKATLHRPQSTRKQTCSSHTGLESRDTEAHDDIERDIHSSLWCRDVERFRNGSVREPYERSESGHS